MTFATTYSSHLLRMGCWSYSEMLVDFEDEDYHRQNVTAELEVTTLV